MAFKFSSALFIAAPVPVATAWGISVAGSEAWRFCCCWFCGRLKRRKPQPGGMLLLSILASCPICILLTHAFLPHRPYWHAGNFELQCRVGDHVRAGMRALYTVLPSKEPYRVHLSGAKRTYYIQAEPATWDYAPGGYAQCSNTDLADDSVVFLNRSASTIGSVYRKAVYRWGGGEERRWAGRKQAARYSAQATAAGFECCTSEMAHGLLQQWA